MLSTLISTYSRPRRAAIIYPGRNPIFFNPYVSKDDSVLSVGRLVDAGKQVFLLTQHVQPFPVCIVGEMCIRDSSTPVPSQSAFPKGLIGFTSGIPMPK